MIKLNLILIILLFSCNSIYAQANFDAVIVGENVRMRSTSDIKGKVIATLSTGAVVTIIQQTKVRDIIKLENDFCDDYGYYWYEVKTSSKQTGWVYGAFIYSINNDSEQDKVSVYYKAYNNNGPLYYLNQAKSNTYGAADENGPTFCDEPSIVFFYKKNESKMYPIRLVYEEREGPGKLMTTKDKNWLLLYSGEGGKDIVSDIKIEKDIVVMTINRSFQEGGAIAVLKLAFKNTYFEAKVDSYLTMFEN